MSVKFSKNNRFLVSGSYDASVRLWDAQKGELIYTFLGHKMPVNDVDINHDNTYILSASSDKTINIWYLNPEILIEYYFEDQFQKELNTSKIFDPRRSGESKAEYKERLRKAEEYKKEFIEKYLNRIKTP